jgi:bifunctional UDP-N-acetylglucosamine pyrophosphorylase/glucosamine-1-phosphate N-acetyltransferase
VLIEGSAVRMVEAKDATPDELACDLCNSGVLLARAPLLWNWLGRIGNANAAGEYYLPDAVMVAQQDGARVAVVETDGASIAGVNSRAELAQAEAAFQAMRREELMAAGVSLRAPETVWLSWDTQLEPDVTVEPFVVFGPGVRVASGSTIRAHSHLEGAEVGPGCDVGPFARLRPGTVLRTGAKIGNFVETKKAVLGEGAKANHLSYLGDAEIGAGANIGAGTITCNYDGYGKHRTTIGARAFIGSNSALVAPVAIGDDAIVGAGSTITADVAAGDLALVRPPQTARTGWAARFHALMRARKAGRQA